MITSGNPSTTLTSQLDTSLDGVSLTDSMKLCNPNTLNQFKIKPLQFDNDENSFTWDNLSPEKQKLFIKCMLVIKYLSDEAIEEANENLEEIIDFYSEDLTDNYHTSLPTYQTTIKGKILPPKTRPSLVLDDF